MTEEVSHAGEPFDLEKLRELIELMEAHDLAEVSLRSGDREWTLRRGNPGGVTMMPAPAASAPVPAASAAAAPSAGAETPDDGTVVIKSPTVGTFYASPSPDDPPFVTVGTRVAADTVVCIVEAMKVFNQIPADVSGTIVAILVNNGDAVEFGQPLFRVRPG